MLKKTFEWRRVVHPKPDNQIVEGQTRAVTELLGKLDDADDEDLLGAFATAAVAGFDGKVDTHSGPVATVVEGIRNHQPAFPADLAENALELRITCALALGELVTRVRTKGQQANAVLAASLLIAGSGIRPEERGNHLRTATTELITAAREAVQTRAVEVRERDELDLGPLQEFSPPGDLAAGVLGARNATAAGRKERRVTATTGTCSKADCTAAVTGRCLEAHPTLEACPHFSARAWYPDSSRFGPGIAASASD
jgi:hypothetical protein